MKSDETKLVASLADAQAHVNQQIIQEMYAVYAKKLNAQSQHYKEVNTVPANKSVQNKKLLLLTRKA